MVFFFSSRRRHTRWNCDWSSDVCSSDLGPPSVGHPREQVHGLHELRRKTEDKAVRALSERELAEIPRRVPELLPVQALEDLRLPVPDVRELVALEHDLCPGGREADQEVRRVAREGSPHRPECPQRLAAESQGVPHHRGDLRLVLEGVRDELHVRLSRLRLGEIHPPLAHRKVEGVRADASVRHGQREVNDGLALRLPHDREEEGDRLRPGLREEGTVLHRDLRSRANRLPAPTAGAEPLPELGRMPDRVVHGVDGGRESRGHQVSVRYSFRVFSAMRSQVKCRRTRFRPALPILAASFGSSMTFVIAFPRRTGSPGGTRRPVSPSTTTSLIPPTRVATTGVSHAIASRLMIPNGSYTDGHANTAASLYRLTRSGSSSMSRIHTTFGIFFSIRRSSSSISGVSGFPVARTRVTSRWTWSIALTRSNTPFWRVRRPTKKTNGFWIPNFARLAVPLPRLAVPSCGRYFAGSTPLWITATLLAGTS